MEKRLFGTDGVRGVANHELKGELAFKLGRIGGYFLSQNYKVKRPVVLIGKDTRLSGDMLEAALMAGLTSVGIDVYRLGIIPTPGVCYLSRIKNVVGGIMISASHNPTADNGIKFFDNNGIKLTDEAELEIEKLIFNDHSEELPYPIDNEIGLVEEKYDWIDEYINFIIDSAEHKLDGLKIVVDCANGAAYQASPSVFKALGAEVYIINNHPNGEEINVNCGSTAPELAAEKVIEMGADLGVAHDGDADRVILIDEKGEIVEGDNIMAVAARAMIEENKLNKKTVVTTKYSNLGLKESLAEVDADLVITRNGDRYVLAEMLKNDYKLGGEKSGHIIFSEYNTTGDGILTAVKIASIIKKKNKSLSELKKVMSYWPQILVNIEVNQKEGWEKNSKISSEIEAAETEISKSGRVFVRASGTEPLIRVMLEGKDKELLDKWENKLTEIISSELN
ncbi:phosphoglucosamine mutase [Halanaerobium congolense]|uniref:Phosphoglucosamine mutase n=1 Tax=Halanaerobium congolense TaxID=54121 RepID=A0A1M7ISK3_9FIRM|nr:phosphoglucosamine mutase [Halanaerobium congolense]PUU92863.1 MAG: phosphoglucosamine mutase [Halanaerobium sp.]PXV63881.1 phosphoglucosamine mutase [Halanaerobium congolense]TDX38412.1 phosphoglucosamine mutase [Halanaerobium congolense]SDG89431.1 phosphoglucosamine mutase [Halanaerobium congolense]SDI87857.1 phosphoglucosamine mutase [Halanaerobium congolense]